MHSWYISVVSRWVIENRPDPTLVTRERSSTTAGRSCQNTGLTRRSRAMKNVEGQSVSKLLIIYDEYLLTLGLSMNSAEANKKIILIIIINKDSFKDSFF